MPMTDRDPTKVRRRRWWIELSIFLALFLLFRAYQQWDMATGTAPAFTGISVPDGARVDLEHYRGKPLVVHFWASWCGVCKASQHNITALAEDHAVLTVAAQSGPPEAVSQYLAERPMGAPVLADPHGDLAGKYGVRAYPSTFILDGTGRIRHVEVGYSSELGLRARLWLASF